MLSESIKKLVQYGIETGLTPACEKNYTTNLLLDVFKEDEYVEVTPHHIRLRKIILDETERKRSKF